MDNESYFWFLNVLFYDLEVCVYLYSFIFNRRNHLKLPQIVFPSLFD